KIESKPHSQQNVCRVFVIRYSRISEGAGHNCVVIASQHFESAVRHRYTGGQVLLGSPIKPIERYVEIVESPCMIYGAYGLGGHLGTDAVSGNHSYALQRRAPDFEECPGLSSSSFLNICGNDLMTTSPITCRLSALILSSVSSLVCQYA